MRKIIDNEGLDLFSSSFLLSPVLSLSLSLSLAFCLLSRSVLFLLVQVDRVFVFLSSASRRDVA